MWLYEKMIIGSGTAYGLPEDVGSDIEDAERIYGIGMPTGCLLSQLTGNLCLSLIDNIMKREEGVRNLARYMDDTVMVDNDYDKVKRVCANISVSLRNKIMLKAQ